MFSISLNGLIEVLKINWPDQEILRNILMFGYLARFWKVSLAENFSLSLLLMFYIYLFVYQPTKFKRRASSVYNMWVKCIVIAQFNYVTPITCVNSNWFWNNWCWTRELGIVICNVANVLIQIIFNCTRYRLPKFSKHLVWPSHVG